MFIEVIAARLAGSRWGCCRAHGCPARGKGMVHFHCACPCEVMFEGNPCHMKPQFRMNWIELVPRCVESVSSSFPALDCHHTVLRRLWTFWCMPRYGFYDGEACPVNASFDCAVKMTTEMCFPHHGHSVVRQTRPKRLHRFGGRLRRRRQGRGTGM